MVCDMLVAADGEIYAYQFYPAVMFSHARFTYTEVAAILGNTRGPERPSARSRVKDLLNLHDVYRALLKQRASAVRSTSNHRDADHLRRRRSASRRSCRARATRRTA
jgi:exoribonuclease R